MPPPPNQIFPSVSGLTESILAPSRNVNGASKQQIQSDQRQSVQLKKELRLQDLIGIQILGIVAYTWIGTAGKLGSSHLMFWLPAVLLFYIPSGVVVGHLAKEMPLEGGMYQWARLRFGRMAGFLVAMNLWFTNAILTSNIGLVLADMVPNVFGLRFYRLTTNKPAIIAVSLTLVCSFMLVAWRGLSIGKWISTFGAFAMVVVFAGVIVVAAPHWFRRVWAVQPASLTFPAVSLLNINILAKMGFGALCGADYVAVFAAECRSADVSRAIRQSIWIASPLIAAMMVMGTASVLTFSRPQAIDLVMPPIQVFSIGAPMLARFFAALVIASSIANGCLAFNILTRFPMVAGWNHLLPDWFSRLDPRYRTPVGSVMFAGLVVMFFAVVGNTGAGVQEAYQFLTTAGLICEAGAYLVMFAIPLFGPTESPRAVRIAAASGFLMTLLFVTLSAFPIVDEQNPGVFTTKMVAVIGGIQCGGLLIYRRARRSDSPERTP